MEEQKDATEGRKYDGGKERWDLIPKGVVVQVVRVLTMGAKKYAPDNWKHVDGARRRYYAAASRHLEAWWKGENLDPEWNLPHLAHLVCCAFFLMWLDDPIHDQPGEEPNP